MNGPSDYNMPFGTWKDRQNFLEKCQIIIIIVILDLTPDDNQGDQGQIQGGAGALSTS